MGILEAAQSLTVLDAAIGYANAGVSVIPLQGKKAGAWKTAQSRRAGGAQIQGWDAAGKFGNVGIVCGDVSGGLVVVDCDGIAATKMFADRFPELRETLVVVTGSRQGVHYYFYVQLMPETTRLTGLVDGTQNIELRANGHYVVAAPSIHPDTQKLYVVGRALPPKRVNNLEYVIEWLESMRLAATDPKPKNMKRSAAPHPSGGGGGALGYDSNGKPIRNPESYARAALRQECDKIAAARAVGGRNTQINESSIKMGGLIADGWIERGMVERALFNAAQASGYVNDDGESQTIGTIASGIEAGIGSSRAAFKTR
ncbi:MAG: bifunctional DNA primase/polymerase [bacterium]|nr:bifunctional DNA primase/polymerase [bacterium]